jgi:hypothetical protein
MVYFTVFHGPRSRFQRRAAYRRLLPSILPRYSLSTLDQARTPYLRDADAC